jgi:hypothetical protein
VLPNHPKTEQQGINTTMVGTDSTGEQHVALEKRVRPPPHTASPTAPAEKEEG